MHLRGPLLQSLVVLLALPFTINAQTAAPTPVRASVGDVTDSRSTGTFNSECKVELKFTGDPAADAARVRQVRVSKAVDELGRDITPKKSDDSSDFGNSGFGGSTLKAEVKLRNPSRNATVIKLIEGEVELFNPTPANGGILIIKDILKHPAEPVEDPTLKKFGIQLMYLTKESYEAKKKEIEAQQKDNAGSALGEAFADLFKGMFSGMMSSDSKNSVKLYVKDPQKRVVEVEFQDAAGKPLKRRGSWSTGEMRSQDFDAPPPPDTRIKIDLATPEATRTFPFKVENIPLP